MSLVQNESRKVLPLDVCAKYFKQALKKFYSIQRKILVKFSSQKNLTPTTTTCVGLFRICSLNMRRKKGWKCIFDKHFFLAGKKYFLFGIIFIVLLKLAWEISIFLWNWLPDHLLSPVMRPYWLKSSWLTRPKELWVTTQCPWEKTSGLHPTSGSDQHLHFHHWFYTVEHRGFRSIEVLGHFCEISEYSNTGSH